MIRYFLFFLLCPSFFLVYYSFQGGVFTKDTLMLKLGLRKRRENNDFVNFVPEFSLPHFTSIFSFLFWKFCPSNGAILGSYAHAELFAAILATEFSNQRGWHQLCLNVIPLCWSKNVNIVSYFIRNRLFNCLWR